MVKLKPGGTMSDFFKELMDSIVDSQNVPKVQVERSISPILGMFIESIVEEHLEGKDKYRIVSEEFPLRVEGSLRSTNVDWLLVNEKKDRLVLVELKTCGSSYRTKQLERYTELQEQIENGDSGVVLREDLKKIWEAGGSKERRLKYECLVEAFDERIGSPPKIESAAIVYIVPTAVEEIVRRKFGGRNDCFVHSLVDVANTRTGDCERYGREWELVKSALVRLDDSSSEFVEDGSLGEIVENVEDYARAESLVPLSIRVGKTGTGKRPNYQVEFSDRTEKAFRNNGSLFKEEGFLFSDDNLEVSSAWDEFKELYCA
jgi:hypothetical protein